MNGVFSVPGKGSVPKLRRQSSWLSLHLCAALVSHGWQHADPVQRLLKSLVKRHAQHMVVQATSNRFTVLQTCTMILLASSLTPMMTPSGIYLAREPMGSFNCPHCLYIS